jgi:flagellin
MSRINNNVPSLIAQRVLATQNDRLSRSLQRLSTGLRINAGKDDPSGLIASEIMRSEMRAIQAAQGNVARAVNVAAVAEGGLTEITSMLDDIESLVDQTSNDAAMTDEERQANQLEIDRLLESINRIANTTQLQGRKLLNGDLAYTMSGVRVSQLADVRINSARVPAGSYRAVNVTIARVASLAVVGYTGGTIATSARTIEITGNRGTDRFTFGVGTTVANMISAINMSRALTGVSAKLSGGTAMRLNSIDYGSSQFVRVRLLSGSSFATLNNVTEDFGGDVAARVNGMTAVGEGLKLRVRGDSLSADILLTAGMATQTAAAAAFNVTRGGAKFEIGPQINPANEAMIGIDRVSTTQLGDSVTGWLYTLGTGETNDLKNGNYETAQKVIRLANLQVASLRGRIGSFEKSTLDATANSLEVQYENVAAAESAIRDTDFAAETSALTRSQILVQAAMNVLQLANQAPNNVLTLLRG